MTRIITFLGKAQYLREAIEKNRLTDIFIDKSYIIGEVYYDKRISYHYVDTGIKPSNSGEVEMVNRRIRIAKMIKEIISKIDDDILFLDSDVVVNNIQDVIKRLENVNVPTTIAILAKAKPFNSVILFSLSTNFYLPSLWKSKLGEVINRYIGDSLYINNPVDIYIHLQLLSKTLHIGGVCHYIDGQKYCT